MRLGSDDCQQNGGDNGEEHTKYNDGANTKRDKIAQNVGYYSRRNDGKAIQQKQRKRPQNTNIEKKSPSPISR